jgi:type VI protein secretion system component VasK
MSAFLDRRSRLMVATTFWETFFLLLIFLPLLLVWAFALVDIFRRDDIHGVMKALWVAAVILVPFLGTLVYLMIRPPGVTPEERAMVEHVHQQREEMSAASDTTTQLQMLADLHDRGKLTDSEFAAEKARLLGT